MNGAGLEYQASWDNQAFPGLVVYLASRANPDSQEHQAFQALRDILERKVQGARQVPLHQLEREVSLG